MGEVVELFPVETERPRWIAKRCVSGFEWIVADTWRPGDFGGFFKTRAAAGNGSNDGRRDPPQGSVFADLKADAGSIFSDENADGTSKKKH